MDALFRAPRSLIDHYQSGSFESMTRDSKVTICSRHFAFGLLFRNVILSPDSARRHRAPVMCQMDGTGKVHLKREIVIDTLKMVFDNDRDIKIFIANTFSEKGYENKSFGNSAKEMIDAGMVGTETRNSEGDVIQKLDFKTFFYRDRLIYASGYFSAAIELYEQLGENETTEALEIEVSEITTSIVKSLQSDN